MNARDAHPSSRIRRLSAGQKVAAMTALKATGDPFTSDSLAAFQDATELTLGFQVVIEQLSVELAHATDRTPEKVLSDIATTCAAALTHPDPPAPGMVD